MVRPLTDEERATFEEILRGDGVALLQVEYEGRDAAAIARVEGEDEETVRMWPLAVLVDSELLTRLTLDGVAPTEEGADIGKDGETDAAGGS